MKAAWLIGIFYREGSWPRWGFVLLYGKGEKEGCRKIALEWDDLSTGSWELCGGHVGVLLLRQMRIEFHPRQYSEIEKNIKAIQAWSAVRRVHIVIVILRLVLVGHGRR